MTHILAHKDGIALVLGLLFAQGAMCEKCGHGTRATSKNWARCKKCGHRNRRQTLEQIEAEAAARAAEQAAPHDGEPNQPPALTLDDAMGERSA